MKIRILGPAVLLSLACLWLGGVFVSGRPAMAAETASAEAPAADRPSAEERTAAQEPEEGDSGARHEHRRHRRHGDSVVMIGHDATLAAGEHADAVVSIDGSSASAGEADTVVSILGDTKVTGAVSDSAVSILGGTYVDSAVEGDVVAVLGSVELGPHAEVGGDVVAVGGEIRRAPSAIVHGALHSVAGYAPGAAWLRPWVEHCLFYGRPLAFVPGIDWAWTIAISMLALYLCLTLVFRDGVSRCADTLEAHSGTALLAALLTVLIWPLLLALLAITVIGLLAVPLIGATLLCAALFGKAVVLTWMGRRCLRGFEGDAASHPAAALLAGGLIALILYVIPVIGFVALSVLGLFGLGAVVYTLMLEVRSRRGTAESRASAAPAPPAAPAAAAADQAPAAAASAETAPGAVGDAAAVALPHAGFWIRMAALLVDVLVVSIPTSLLERDGPHPHLLILAIYAAAMWKLKGATIGCMVFDLRVVRQDGRPIDWETAIVRALGCFLSLAVAGLGFFWVAVDQAKLAWHDKIAGTAVVRVARAVKT